jgi:hypothetical protein
MDHEMEIADNPLARSASPYLEFFDSVDRAATWIREKYGLDRDEIIVDHFEREFDCVVIIPENEMSAPVIIFNNEIALNWFTLRWA